MQQYKFDKKELDVYQPAEDCIAQYQSVIQKLKSDGWLELRFEILEREWGDPGECGLYIVGKRPMTEKEIKEKEIMEHNAKQHRKKLYEDLQKEFGT